MEASDRHRAGARNPHRRRRANVRFALPIIRVSPGGNLRPAPRPTGPRNRTSLSRGKRGDGLERRPLGSSPGGARHSPPQAGRRDEPPTPARLPSQHPLHQPSRRGAPASSPGGGLRPASRGSAKPAPTTPRQRETRTSDHQGCSRWKPPTGTLAEGQRQRAMPVTLKRAQPRQHLSAPLRSGAASPLQESARPPTGRRPRNHWPAPGNGSC